MEVAAKTAKPEIDKKSSREKLLPVPKKSGTRKEAVFKYVTKLKCLSFKVVLLYDRSYSDVIYTRNRFNLTSVYRHQLV